MRFIQGFTGAAGIVIARASARDMYSGKELTAFFSLLMLVNGAAPILAPITGGIYPSVRRLENRICRAGGDRLYHFCRRAYGVA